MYTAERDGKFYVIEDESSLVYFLDDEDLGDLIHALEFDALADRDAYIRERGWDRPDPFS